MLKGLAELGRATLVETWAIRRVENVRRRNYSTIFNFFFTLQRPPVVNIAVHGCRIERPP